MSLNSSNCWPRELLAPTAVRALGRSHFKGELRVGLVIQLVREKDGAKPSIHDYAVFRKF